MSHIKELQLSAAQGAIMSATHVVNTSIRTAFENIKVMNSANTKEGQRIAGLVWDGIASKAGLVKRNDWNAHLTFGTFKTLKAQGVMQ